MQSLHSCTGVRFTSDRSANHCVSLVLVVARRPVSDQRQSLVEFVFENKNETNGRVRVRRSDRTKLQLLDEFGLRIFKSADCKQETRQMPMHHSRERDERYDAAGEHDRIVKSIVPRGLVRRECKNNWLAPIGLI